MSYSKSVWLSENNATNLVAPKHEISKPKKQKDRMKVYFRQDIAEKTLGKQYWGKNDFVKFVLSICTNEAEKQRALEVLEAYRVGTCSEGTVFWFCDTQERYHAGQVKTFNQETGKTIDTTWIHSVLHKKNPSDSWLEKYYDQDEKVTCLFGEHLLALPENENKIVILVESPKNALISAIFLPREDAIYLATYSLSSFTPQRCDAIIGKKILLLPDLG